MILKYFMRTSPITNIMLVSINVAEIEIPKSSSLDVSFGCKLVQLKTVHKPGKLCNIGWQELK